ncbi:MAG TPA: 4Fe-4S binding protein [Candidatus Limnocylindrales bacterium]|nr:4Fe-4S binding protein [Candidatus Limnocylindrales bacterium]
MAIQAALPGQTEEAPTEQRTDASTKTAQTKKKLIRRSDVDRSQLYRQSFQGAFLLLNLWLGAKFYFWVRQFEVGVVDANLRRPAGVEGWLPIAGLMNLKYWLMSGQVPHVHPAAMFLLVTFLSMAFLFRKAFCSWLCPIGTLSEYLWRAGKKLFKRNFFLPRWLDLPLRGLKYFLLGFFVWAISTMSVVGIRDFMQSPYGLIADVKMLNFFRHIGETGLIVLGVFVVASVFVPNFWCRFLCPYGALLGLSSWLSPTRIRRNAETCIDCAKCAKVCPSALPVDKLVQIRSVECTGCLECVAVCPAQDALAMSLPKTLPAKPKPVALPAWAMAAGIAVLFLGVAGFAKVTGHWESPIPTSVYERLVPHADQAAHPMPGR